MNKNLLKYGREIIRSVRFKEASDVTHHHVTNVARHSYRVAAASDDIANFLINKGIKVDREMLLRAALLHDIAMTVPSVKSKVGIIKYCIHPFAGSRLAKCEYELDKKTLRAIRFHMWPLTIIPPTSREGWILLAADKYCSIIERTKAAS